jgi:hypothetical protein
MSFSRPGILGATGLNYALTVVGSSSASFVNLSNWPDTVLFVDNKFFIHNSVICLPFISSCFLLPYLINEIGVTIYLYVHSCLPVGVEHNTYI